MSQSKTTKKSDTRRKNGTFDKGNTIGNETRFAKDNKAACKYKDEYCDQIIEYFSQPLLRVEYKETYFKGELSSKTPMLFPNEYPTFELFAAKIGVSVRTLAEWRDKYPRFADCYARAKEIQFGKLTSGAVIGEYNPLYAKFEAVNNHGLKDKQVFDANVDETVHNPPVDEKTLALIERVEARLKNAKKK